jgi:hypothetical protein
MTTEEEWWGIALYQGNLYALTGILAEFILDYPAYDPDFSASPNAASFRGGALRVTQENIPQFLQALKARVLTPQDVQSFLDSLVDESRLIAFIDFDSRQFVHSYYDLALEDYIPKGWRGKLGNPREEILRRYHNR